MAVFANAKIWRPGSGALRLIAFLLSVLLGTSVLTAFQISSPSESASAANVSCAAGMTAQQGLTATPSHGQVFYIDSGVTPKVDAAYVGYRVASASDRTVWTSLEGFTGGKVTLANPADQYQQLVLNSANSRTLTSFYLLKALGSTTTAQGHTLKIYDRRPDLTGATALLTCDFTFSKVAETIKAQSNKVNTVTVTNSGGTTKPTLGGTVTVAITSAATGKIGNGSAPDLALFWATPASQSTWPTQALRLESTSIALGCAGNSTLTLTNRLTTSGSEFTTCTSQNNQSWTASYVFRVIGPGASVQPAPVAVISSGTQYKHSDAAISGVPTIDLTGVAPVTTAVTTSVTLSAAYASNPTSSTARIRYTATISTTSTTAISIDELVAKHPTGATYVANSTNSGLNTASGSGPEPSELVSDTTSPKLKYFIGPFTGIQSGASTSYKLSYSYDIPCDGTTYSASVSAYVGNVQIAKDANTVSGITISASAGGCSNPTIGTGDVALNPTVSTAPATSVDSSSATLNGWFNASGNTGVERRFIWGTDPNLAGATAGTWTSITGSTSQALTQSLTGLSSARVYYFQAQIRTSAGAITYGDILNFKTWDVQKDPTAITLAATGVTTNSVTMNGSFNPNGIPITGAYFRYSSSNAVTSGVLSGTSYELRVTTDDGSGSAVNLTYAAGSYGDVAINTDDPITGSQYAPTGSGQQNPALSGTYYFQVKLTCTTTGSFCPTGFIYGPVLSFTMGAATATTADATVVADTTATLNGTVKSPTNSGGSATSIKFCYATSNAVSATTGALTTCLNSGPNNANTSSIAQNTTQTTFLNLTGLTHGTVYYFQIIAQVGSGAITYGSVFAFQTLDITTGTTLTAGVINGNYTAFTFQGVGGSTTYSWAVTSGTIPPGMTLASNGLFSGTPTTAGSYSFVVRMTDESTGMTTDETFTMAVTGAPTVTTTSATSVTGTSAVMNGEVNPNGAAITSASWCWGTNQTLSSCTTVLISNTVYNAWSINSSNSTSATLTGLSNGTTYYYRLTAQNNNGTVASTPIISFTTTGAPSVSATGAVSVTGSTVTLGGTVSPNGATVSSAQICYGASLGSMTICADVAESFGSWSTSSTNNSVSRAITGLTPGSTYYYKVTATNASGSSETSGTAFTMASATTLTASGLGNVAATIRGTLNAGSSSISTSDASTIELCYSTANTVTDGLLSANDKTCVSVTKSSVSSGTSGTFSTALTGLTAGTQYWSQIKVTFANTTVVFGSPVSFTTLAAPGVTTAPASSVGITTATLNGSVDAKGSAITSATFCYGTASDLASCTTVSVTITGWTTGSGNNATATITGLSANTKYYFKLTAINGVGTGTSATPHENFTTIDAPIVEVAPSVRVTSKGATIKGLVDRKGARLNKVTFCWSLNPISSLSDCTDSALDDTTVTTINGNNSSSQISKVMSGLQPRTTYYYIVSATSGNGGVVAASVKGAKTKASALRAASMRNPIATYGGSTSASQSVYAAAAPDVVVYSSSSSFTTAGAVTNSATNIGATSANINGTLFASSSGLATADVTNVKLCYSTSNSVDANGLLSTSPICSSDLWNSGSITANGSQAYSVALSSLSPSTTYYSQIQSTFYDGNTANGSVVSFTTPALPSATTNNATSISQNSAVLNGTINANGTTLNSVSFCYSVNSDLSNCTSVTVTRPGGGWSTGTNSVSATITSLSSSTKYYFRVTGVNDYGTVSGSTLNFNTLSALSFNSKGGTSVSAIYFAANSTVAEPTAPTKTGYTFAGWYDAETGGTAINWSTPFAGTDQTLYAYWTPISYNVTYDSHGGSTASGGSTTYTIGGSVTLPSAPSRTGYTFEGWSTSATGTAISGTTYNPPATGDITLHALWHAIDYTVVFNSHGGSAVADKTYNIGGSITKPADPTRAGYQFNGWYDASTGGNLIAWPSGSYAPPTGGITLHAQWTAYTVTYSNGSYGGTIPSSTSGPVASLPDGTGLTPPSASGYQFSGWACPTGSGTLAPGSAFTPTSNVTCTAVWVPTGSNTVTFNSNYPGANPTNTTSTQSNNVTANLATNGFSIAGYTFAGWSTSSSSSSIAYSQNAPYDFSTGSTNLYAVWTANTYTVSFDSQGGSAVDPKTFTTGGSITAPTSPTRAGYTFNGWFIDPNIGNALTFNYSPGTTSNVTLYAQWSPDPKTVTFNSNYPGASPTNTTTTQSNYVTTQLDANTFSIDGYTFTRWNTLANGNGTPYSATATYNFLAPLSLYAVWTPISYSVIYNTQGGSSVANGSYSTGGSVTLPSAPSKTGYVFAGWFTNSSGGSALGATYSPSGTGSITLWAQWTAGTNTVIYNSQGGSSVPNGSFTTGSSIAALSSDPTKTANEFKGWYLASTGGSALSFPYTPGTVGTLTLFAQWAPWVVTFALGSGGSTPATGTVPDPMSGEIANLPGQGNMNAPAGYVFGGWTCAGSPTNYPEGASITPTGTTVCTAVWNVSTGRTVTFHSNYPAGTNTTTTQTSATATTLNPNPFVAGGFAFGGWATSAGGGVVFTDRQSYNFNLDADLYAVWYRQSSGDPAYVINFLYQGGTSGITVTYYTIGSPGISLPSSTRPGYTFTGWAPAPSSSTTVAAPFTTNANVTLYAQWVPNTVVITFNYLGGVRGILTKRYTVGKPGVVLPTSTKSGYEFAGWSTVNGGSTPVENPYSPTENVTLYAIWNGTQYIVTLVPGGAEPKSTLTYTVGGPGLDLPELTDPALTFIGWHPKTNAIRAIREPFKPNRNITLYPIWKDIPANTSVFFGGDSPIIDAKAKRVLRGLARIISKARSHPQMVVDGWVKETLNKSYDQQLSAQRAKNAAAYLRSIGVDAVARITPKGISPENTAASRRVDISVYYSGPDKKKKA